VLRGSTWDIGAYEYVSGLSVTSPNGGEVWRRGETHTITWMANGISGDLVIELLQNAAVVGTIALSVDAAAGTYSWTVGRLESGNFVTGTNLKVRIRSLATGQVMKEMELQ